jgi:hypothetical protein
MAGQLPPVRPALVEGLLGMALTQANVLWREVEMGELERCAVEVGEFVDLLLAAMAQLDEVKKCLSRSTPTRKSKR